MSRDADAALAIESTVRQRLGAAAIKTIRVIPEEDHTGDPALSVLIDLAGLRFRPSGADWVSFVMALRDALQDVGDTRFPYVSFSAPDDEQAEDARGAA